MKMGASYAVAVCSALLFGSCASSSLKTQRAPADSSYSDLLAGQITLVEIDELHPTQFRVGQAEVDDKAKKFESMSGKKITKYLKKHPCPVVIGPGGVPYVTDEQHRANALEEDGQATMYMKIIANWSGLTADQFQQKMIANHYTYLKDLGVPRSFNDLPEHVEQMKDDPFRSLAGFTEKTAWKEEKDVYFIQFQVADWLRQHLGMSEAAVASALSSAESRSTILEKTTELLESKEASNEPWYGS